MKIFQENLPESAIKDMSENDLNILIEEATHEHLRLEKEIEDLVWPGQSYLTEDGQPKQNFWPSEFSYLPALYADRIAKEPGLKDRLEKADELSKRIGYVLAVRGTAEVQKAVIASLTARIERAKNQEYPR